MIMQTSNTTEISSELKNKLESVLFSLGRKLSLDELSKLCREPDLELIKHALADLGNDLESKNSSLMLVEENNHYKITVREKYAAIVRKVVRKTELPKTVLETLAVVAFKAPVLQSKVISVRTNKAYDHLAVLEETGYITREKSGRTKLVKLTKKFFEYFDIPPEQLKLKFCNVSQIESAIAVKEAEVAKEQVSDFVEEDEKLGQLEVYTPEQEKASAESRTIQPYKEQLGELDIYETETEGKNAKEDVQKQKVASEAQAQESLNENVPEKEPAEVESETSEPAQLQELESEKTEEKEKEPVENAQAPPSSESQPPEREFEGEGLFSEGVPNDVQDRVDKRVNELIEGEKQESEDGL